MKKIIFLMIVLTTLLLSVVSVQSADELEIADDGSVEGTSSSSWNYDMGDVGGVSSFSSTVYVEFRNLDSVSRIVGAAGFLGNGVDDVTWDSESSYSPNGGFSPADVAVGTSGINTEGGFNSLSWTPATGLDLVSSTGLRYYGADLVFSPKSVGVGQSLYLKIGTGYFDEDQIGGSLTNLISPYLQNSDPTQGSALGFQAGWDFDEAPPPETPEFSTIGILLALIVVTAGLGVFVYKKRKQ